MSPATDNRRPHVRALVQRTAANEPGFDVVHANLLRFFPELVQELGGDPHALMRELEIEPASLWNAATGLSYRSWALLLEHAAARLGCSDFGMRLACLQGGKGGFGQMGVVMKNSATLGDAIDYVANHFFVHSLAAGMYRVPNAADRTLVVGHEILVDGLGSKRQIIEQVLLLGHFNVVEITGGRARVREVRFRHQPLSSRATYRLHFGCGARFNEREDGVVFSERDLRCPIVDPDQQLYRSATTLLDRQFASVTQPLHAQVRALIIRLVETEDCSNERICAQLGLHPRTLHRRLKLEGKSFESIKNDVRRDQALRYLQETDHSLSVIAEKLGYAEQSVLTRSCIRWFAARPSDLRSPG